METSEILHKLRNPHGFSDHDMRVARLEAANEIERWKDAFENLQQWARDNGLDTATYSQTVQVTTDSLVVCPVCNGVGHINVSGLDTYCLMCKGYGSVRAESNTPSA